MKIIVAVIIATFFSLNAFAQDAKNIIDKHIAAIGGEKSWKNIKTFRVRSIERSADDTIMLTATKIRDKAFRSDMVSHKENNVDLFVDNEGWISNNGRKTKASPRECLIFKKNTRIAGDLFNFKHSGCTVQYIKNDTVDGKKCYVVLFTKDGDMALYYFDVKSYYLIKEIFGYKNEMVFSNFKHFPEGIVIPMTTTQLNATINVLDVEINKPIDEAVFDPNKL